MKTLKDLTNALTSAGCFSSKMERSYKRRDHREVLVRCFIAWRTDGKIPAAARNHEGNMILNDLCNMLREDGFELTHDSWSHSCRGNVEIWVQAKVALAEGF